MKNIRNRLMTLAVAGSIVLASCADLTVDNLNNPDTDRALSSASDLTTLAEGLVKNWYNAIHNYDGFKMPAAVLADAASCSWGNVGMREMGTEPRPSFNNSPSYNYLYLAATPFTRMYSVNSSAVDVIKAVQGGVIDFGSDGPRVEAISHFARGIAMGYIALAYDRGYIIDESTAQEDIISPTLVDYNTMMDHAVATLVKAATIAKNNSFSLNETVIKTPGGVSSDQLAQMAHSFIARFMTNVARTEAERMAVNWNEVITHVSNGITADVGIINQLAPWQGADWYDEGFIYAVYPGWGRVDMRVINMMDDSYPKHNPAGEDFAAPDSARIFDNAEVDDRLWTDYQHLSSNNFRPERGLYFFSSFRYDRHSDYIGPWDAILPDLTISEMDMYHAEALAMTGNLAGAAAILNDASKARKVRGGLPDVAADKDAIMAAIHHERMVETFLDASGSEWFEMRGKDMLQKGSPLHWPIPADVLETLGFPLPYYTYGGETAPATGNGSPDGDYWPTGTASGAKAWR
jgi:hypothetical protein